MGKSAKYKEIMMGRDGPRGSCGKEALNHQIFNSYLQSVGRKHLHAELSLTGYGVQQWPGTCTGSCPRVVSQHP
jgi:hypothetical protein